MGRFFLFCLLVFSVQAYEFKSLDQLLSHPKILSAKYSMVDEVLKRESFVWTSMYKKSMRTTKPQDLFGLNSIESIMHFSQGRVSKVELLYFSKSDSEKITYGKFDDMRSSLGSTLTKTLKVKGRKVKPGKGDIAENVYYEWIRGNVKYRLEVAGGISGKFEFLRLLIKHKDSRKLRYKTPAQLQRMVKRNREGDVYINQFPMVDQGAKGYCVCASLARVLKHYGRDIDQHEIAQMANSSKFGTSPQDLMSTLEELSPKLYVDNHSLGDFAIGKVRASTLEEFVRNSKRYFSENRVKFSRYENHLYFAIDAGRPIAWALVVGLIPEKGVEQGELYGHMRVIVGYNKRTKELLYTDSWGVGHDLKRMKIADAMAASFGMWEMRPEF